MIAGRIINKEGKPSVNIAVEDFLGDFAIDWAMMEVPTIQLTLPAKYSKYITGNTLFQLMADDWVYDGYVESKDLRFGDNTVSVQLAHVLNKLSKRTLPTNVTIKNKSIKGVIETTWGFWKDEEYIDDIVNKFSFNYVDSYAERYMIEYEFSNETIVEFLTKVCEKSPDLYWRVNRRNPYQIDFGVFGTRKNVLINEENHLISLEDISEDYTEITNVAVVKSDKSDGGASSLTLRDIFYNKHLMVSGFPVIMTGNKVNSQRHYQYPQIPQFAPEIIGDEFALMDEEGVALEAGELYWGTIVENDTQAIAEDNEVITNDDRIKATQQLYQSAIRKLKNSRRKITYNMTVSPLPSKACQIGDKVMFKLDIGVHELTPCSRYYEKLLKADDWFFVTKLVDRYTEGNGYLQTVELSKELYSERDITATT